jgi:hypothetical protein
MADKEDATPSLGDTEVLSVKHPPGHAVPELGPVQRRRPRDPTFLLHFPLVSGPTFHTVGRRFRGRPRRKQAIDVLEENPTGSRLAATTRQRSWKSPLRSPARPARGPATEMSWQGHPPTRTSTCWHIAHRRAPSRPRSIATFGPVARLSTERAVGVDLALPHRLGSRSVCFQAPARAATNAREERADAHHCLHASHVVSLGQIENSAGFGSDAGLLDSKPHVVSMVSTPPLFERD